MTLLENIKAAVRIRDSVPQTDAEKQRENDIKSYITAAKDELRRVGVSENFIVDSDARLIQSCKLFVMASIDYHGKGDVYWQRFNEYVKAYALDAERLEAQQEAPDV